MPSRGDNFVSMADVIKVLAALGCVFHLDALACTFPDEGNMPLRRAVLRVQMLPESVAWSQAVHKDGAVVQYAVLLDQPVRMAGRCYWPVEARAEGKLWRRFLVTPNGKNLIVDGARP